MELKIIKIVSATASFIGVDGGKLILDNFSLKDSPLVSFSSAMVAVKNSIVNLNFVTVTNCMFSLTPLISAMNSQIVVKNITAT